MNIRAYRLRETLIALLLISLFFNVMVLRNRNIYRQHLIERLYEATLVTDELDDFIRIIEFKLENNIWGYEHYEWGQEILHLASQKIVYDIDFIHDIYSVFFSNLYFPLNFYQFVRWMHIDFFRYSRSHIYNEIRYLRLIYEDLVIMREALTIPAYPLPKINHRLSIQQINLILQDLNYGWPD